MELLFKDLLAKQKREIFLKLNILGVFTFIYDFSLFLLFTGFIIIIFLNWERKSLILCSFNRPDCEFVFYKNCIHITQLFRLLLIYITYVDSINMICFKSAWKMNQINKFAIKLNWINLKQKCIVFLKISSKWWIAYEIFKI